MNSPNSISFPASFTFCSVVPSEYSVTPLYRGNYRKLKHGTPHVLSAHPSVLSQTPYTISKNTKKAYRISEGSYRISRSFERTCRTRYWLIGKDDAIKNQDIPFSSDLGFRNSSSLPRKTPDAARLDACTVVLWRRCHRTTKGNEFRRLCGETDGLTERRRR